MLTSCVFILDRYTSDGKSKSGDVLKRLTQILYRLQGSIELPQLEGMKAC